MDQASKMIRRFTVPPVFAAALLIILWIAYPNALGNPWHLPVGLLCLSVLPTLAYPLQKYIPKFKDRGREGQRTLAMIFSFLGYLIGTLIAFLSSAPLALKIIYLEYLFCGVAMLVFNKLFKLKTSGHACGVVGPVLLLLYFKLYIPAIIGTALIIPVYSSGIKTKQHTAQQLIGGSAIPAVVLLLVMTVYHCIIR